MGIQLNSREKLQKKKKVLQNQKEISCYSAKNSQITREKIFLEENSYMNRNSNQNCLILGTTIHTRNRSATSEWKGNISI